MKKYFKVSAIILCICLVGMLFAGCSGIKEMRASQAFYTDKGIEYGGKTYVPFLEDIPYLSPEVKDDDSIYITQKDVPVLLSAFFGQESNISLDGSFIISVMYSDDAEYETKYYCLEEKYDEILATVEKGFTIAGFKYKLYDWWSDEPIEYNFTDAEVKATLSVLSTEPQVITGPMMSEFDQEISITAFSADKYFKNDFFSIGEYKGAYYILEYDKDYNPAKLYTVPNELCKVFKEIVDGYVKNAPDIDEEF